MRRTLALLDADDLDARLAGWMASRVGHLAGRRVRLPGGCAGT
jgi:hypothetical protein